MSNIDMRCMRFEQVFSGIFLCVVSLFSVGGDPLREAHGKHRYASTRRLAGRCFENVRWEGRLTLCVFSLG